MGSGKRRPRPPALVNSAGSLIATTQEPTDPAPLVRLYYREGLAYPWGRLAEDNYYLFYDFGPIFGLPAGLYYATEVAGGGAFAGESEASNVFAVTP